MLELKNTILVPRGDPALPNPFVIDMTEIKMAESRLQDLKVVNPGNYLELVSVFNSATNEISNNIARLHFELSQAKMKKDQRRAVLILDEYPEYFEKIKDKGLKSSNDIRDAFVEKDEAYQKLISRVGSIEAAIKMLDGKYWTFVRAFEAASSVSKKKDTEAYGRPEVITPIKDSSIYGKEKVPTQQFDLSFGHKGEDNGE